MIIQTPLFQWKQGCFGQFQTNNQNLSLLLPLLYIPFIQKSSMDNPFFADHLSQIHEADTLYDSRFSQQMQEQQNWYHEQRSHTKSVLGSWGLAVGDLHYSRDNEVTLRCIVQLVGYRQKELQFRSRTKEEISSLQFERDKYRSYMEQGQRTIEEHIKRIGSLENQLSILRTKSKKGDAQIKKERDDDRKMIAMLRNKNEQILHEIKKKEQEINRMKQQMKKNVGDKTQAKNSFEVFQGIGNRTPSKDRQSNDDKYVFLMQRNERELSMTVKENSMLREKIFQMRDSLVQFNMWVDRQIFGEDVEDSSEPPRAYAHKFYLNHNLLFKKESLTEEFSQLLDVTKDGLIQLREIFRGNCSPPKKVESQLKQFEDLTQPNFKKKISQRRERKTDRMMQSQSYKEQRENKNNRTSIKKAIEPVASQNLTPKSTKLIPTMQSHTQVNIKHFSTKNISKSPPLQSKKIGSVVSRNIPISAIKNSKPFHDHKKEIPFEDDLLSEVISQSNDSSIISHISIEQMGKSRFDKWDILYQEGQ